jgi:hypothetical protein
LAPLGDAAARGADRQAGAGVADDRLPAGDGDGGDGDGLGRGACGGRPGAMGGGPVETEEREAHEAGHDADDDVVDFQRSGRCRPRGGRGGHHPAERPAQREGEYVNDRQAGHKPDPSASSSPEECRTA